MVSVNNSLTMFVEEIDINEITFLKLIGRGAFGVVSHALWCDKEVAVKVISSDAEEKRAFLSEVKQLSRVNHPNIVQLYGASSETHVFLVMEYAEGGSLYNVLHGTPPMPQYSTAHAISWCLQCAEAVEYLHGMKPKPIVHRDLKPPNLLLNSTGTILKICDFGTATEKQSNMTNNKGSAAWMAPEVFEGQSYNEKCDVFSWGIILWEVITRRKPFDELGGQAFSIMWKVHSGTRPPLISVIPEQLQTLMTRCWSGKPAHRPSFVEIVPILTEMSKYLTGADEPILKPKQWDNTSFDYASQFASVSTNKSQIGFPDTIKNTMHYTMGDSVAVGKQIVVEEMPPHRGQISAPPSLAASFENLSSPNTPHIDHKYNKRLSADLSQVIFDPPTFYQNTIKTSAMTGAPSAGQQQQKPAFKRTHRRGGSYQSNLIVPEEDTSYYPNNTGSWDPGRGHRRTNSQGNNTHIPLHHSITAPANLNKTAIEPSVINALTTEYRPVEPCRTSEESMEIFAQHCQYLEEYKNLQAEVGILMEKVNDRKHELERLTKLEKERKNRAEIYEKLMNENESLTSSQKKLLEEVEQFRQRSGLQGVTTV